ncbi:hypothetical protein [Kushneria aurantia]|uniref:Uncharacterized protein n=1 Tax=Kushneria aurantia TaxID=504092 RepID=A0ABV6G829_9GAMM|nr:hypothetical protein [Kushneria aurantia]
MIDPTSLPSRDSFRQLIEDLAPALQADVESSNVGEVHLRFVRRRLVSEMAEAENSTQPDHFILQSPWVSVSPMQGTACGLDIRIVWNERRILRDQAWLHGAAPALPDGQAASVSAAQMSHWVEQYIEASFRAPSPEKRIRRLADLKGQIPFDLLWLFENATQSTRGPFEGYVSDALDNLMERTEPGYRDVIQSLVATALSNRTEQVEISSLEDISSKVLTPPVKRTLRIENIR